MEIKDLIEGEWYVDYFAIFKYIKKDDIRDNMIFFNEYFMFSSSSYYDFTTYGVFEHSTRPATNNDLIKLPSCHPMHLKAKWELTHSKSTVEGLLLIYNELLKL